jgi:hypothetical protein
MDMKALTLYVFVAGNSGVTQDFSKGVRNDQCLLDGLIIFATRAQFFDHVGVAH